MTTYNIFCSVSAIPICIRILKVCCTLLLSRISCLDLFERFEYLGLEKGSEKDLQCYVHKNSFLKFILLILQPQVAIAFSAA